MPKTKTAKSDANIEAELNANKWSRGRRIEFIDFRLSVDGKINRADLVNFFGISIPQASLDLSYYRDLVKRCNPPRENLKYDMHMKVYLRTDDFQPLFPEQCGSPVFFNDLVLAARNELSNSRNFFGFTPSVGVSCLFPPRRLVKDKILADLLDAIRSHLAMHIVYKSLSNEKNSDYLIAPHSFAFDGFRWHIRAYCYDRHEFRDYVLTRILSTDAPRIAAPNDRFPDPIGNGFREVGTSGADDKAWNEFVTLELIANPELPEYSRKAIELDYAMSKDGVLRHEVRKALLFYAVRGLHLSDEYMTLPNEERQLVLRNREEVFALLK